MRIKLLLKFLILMLFTLVSGPPIASSQDVVKLELHPRLAPEQETSVRLLPSELDLKPGNAAVVLLRMGFESNYYFDELLPKSLDLVKLKYNDPAISEEFLQFFPRYQKAMHRAAYMRDASWNYPFGEQRMAEIHLPDVQLGVFAGVGMSLWVGAEIANGNLEAAREGILTQIACAQHISRTPIVVLQYVGISIADSALNRLEILLQQSGSKNFYYALAMLPETLGDIQAVHDVESGMLANTLPSLTDPLPPVGDSAWKQIAKEYGMYASRLGVSIKANEFDELKERVLSVAERELSGRLGFSKQQLTKMGSEEKSLRLLIATSRRYHSQVRVANSLPLPLAIEKMIEIRFRAEKFVNRIGGPVRMEWWSLAIPISFPVTDHKMSFKMYRFHRRVKMLQVVEAIRDHASRNDGRLPQSLADIELFVPDDPWTGRPFAYFVNDQTATLRVAEIAVLSEASRSMPIYQITIATN